MSKCHRYNSKTGVYKRWNGIYILEWWTSSKPLNTSGSSHHFILFYLKPPCSYVVFPFLVMWNRHFFHCRTLIDPCWTGFCNSLKLVAMKMVTQWTLHQIIFLSVKCKLPHKLSNKLLNITYTSLNTRGQHMVSMYTMHNKMNMKFYICIQSCSSFHINSQY